MGFGVKVYINLWPPSKLADPYKKFENLELWGFGLESNIQNWIKTLTSI